MGTYLNTAIRPAAAKTYRLRTIQAGDAAALVQFRISLSPDTEYQRYFAPMHLSAAALDEWAHHLVKRHPCRQLSWVAESETHAIVGLLEIVPDPIERWHGEMAIAVSDSHQQRGIGTALGHYALRGVGKLGMREIVACLLADNRPAYRFIGKLGLPSVWQYDGDVRFVRMTLA